MDAGPSAVPEKKQSVKAKAVIYLCSHPYLWPGTVAND